MKRTIEPFYIVREFNEKTAGKIAINPSKKRPVLRLAVIKMITNGNHDMVGKFPRLKDVLMQKTKVVRAKLNDCCKSHMLDFMILPKHDLLMLLATNPFVNAYLQSDWFGKGIFWALFLLSALSWTVLIYKLWQFSQIRKLSRNFSDLFSEQKQQPLHFQFTSPPRNALKQVPNPYFEIYKTAKQNALQMISRNQALSGLSQASLSMPDLDLICTQTTATALSQGKALEKHLFFLSTAATLGPFLGLLGTVWGILLTFTKLPSGFSASNAAMLSALSMALATTVVGLLIAIPALAGYNYLKNACREYKRELEHFMYLLLGAVELQYRQIDKP